MDYQQGTAIKIVDSFTVAGVATNPTTLTYTITAPDNTETVYIWPGAAEIDNPSVGSFVLSLGAPTDAGYYTYDVDATGTVVASRVGSFTVLPNASDVGTEVPWAIAGPCQPWASSQDIWTCCGQPTEIIDGVECPIDMTAFALEASQVLFELGGRLNVGICEKTVRPCGTDLFCGFQVLQGGHIIGPWDLGYGWSGSGWWWGGRQACGCQPLDRVLLSGYPVREIIEVKIDGAVVASNTYRLDDFRYLMRVRDPANPDVMLRWPSCQMLDLPDTEIGTFSVKYSYGQEPLLIGRDAAAQLGCELYKSCTGAGDCDLPTGVTRINRQGVTIERAAFTAWGMQDKIWKTGLTKVDAFLNAVNPYRMRRRPMVYSPASQMKYARQVGN